MLGVVFGFFPKLGSLIFHFFCRIKICKRLHLLLFFTENFFIESCTFFFFPLMLFLKNLVWFNKKQCCLFKIHKFCFGEEYTWCLLLNVEEYSFMKAGIKYSKNIARAKMHIVGEVEETFTPWTQYSYGTVREGAKLPAWLGDGAIRGSSPIKAILISSL